MEGKPNKKELSARVLSGRLDDLPEMESRFIRVFLSSTFTDMTVERNYLMSNSVHSLREYCFNKGLEFQIIDMRWGVRDEASIDHSTTDVVVGEVLKSKNTSRGPYMVAFLGDKYGYRSLPKDIEASEFRLLRRIAMKLNRDVSVLDEWYLRDDNAEPALYTMRPITDLLPNYDNDEEEAASKKDKDQRAWDQINSSMTKIIREAAVEALKDKLITAEASQKYFRSVTEAELNAGIMDPPEIENKVIAYFRSFLDIDLKDRISGRFTDKLENGSLDLEAEELREKLKWDKIEPKLASNQYKKYALYWTSVGVDTQEPAHADYLEHLRKDFEERMITMINKTIEDVSMPTIGSSKHMLAEVLHHLHFTKKKLEVFCGREEFLKEIQHKLTQTYGEQPAESTNDDSEDKEKDDSEVMKLFGHTANFEKDMKVIQQIKAETQQMKTYLQEQGVIYNTDEVDLDLESDPNRDVRSELISLPAMGQYGHPLIIHGISGSGKTSIMAKIASLSKTWFPDSHLIVKYLGTSPTCTSIKEVLLSICFQIWHLYKVVHPIFLDLNEDFQYLCSYFSALLWRIDTKKNPLVILLDSVDQLHSSDHSYSMQWLPKKLPVNVHLVVSMLPQTNNCLQNMNRILPNQEQYLSVPPLELEAVDNFITKICNKNNRRVTKQQRRFLINKSIKCNQPLYTKLITNEAMKWKSTTSTSIVNVGENIKEAITLFFEGLEKKHGEVVVRKMFGYISASKEGLSSNELEDILSLDDEVLQDTYLYHLPPDAFLIRVATAILTLMESDIKEYMLMRRSGAFRVLNWYHRQFREISAERYLTADIKEKMHATLVDYFRGTYYKKAKPLELYKKKVGTYPHAQRGVPCQPNSYGNIFNIRKFIELPYHLVNSKQFEVFRDIVACDFEWLHSKTKAVSLSELLNDFSSCCDAMDEDGFLDGEVYNDIKIVYDILFLGMDSIRRDASNVAVELIARLGFKTEWSPSLCHLVKDAASWCEGANIPLLVPRSQCMVPPGGILRTSISVQMFQTNMRGENSADTSMMYVCENKKQIYVIQGRTERLSNCHIYTYNLMGSCISKEELHSDVVAMRFMGKDKYLHVRSKNSEDLFVGMFTSPLEMPSPAEHITVSDSGKLFAYSSGSQVYVSGSKRPLTIRYEVDVKDEEEEEEEETDENKNKEDKIVEDVLDGDGIIDWVRVDEKKDETEVTEKEKQEEKKEEDVKEEKESSEQREENIEQDSAQVKEESEQKARFVESDNRLESFVEQVQSGEQKDKMEESAASEKETENKQEGETEPENTQEGEKESDDKIEEKGGEDEQVTETEEKDQTFVEQNDEEAKETVDENDEKQAKEGNEDVTKDEEKQVAIIPENSVADNLAFLTAGNTVDDTEEIDNKSEEKVQKKRKSNKKRPPTRPGVKPLEDQVRLVLISPDEQYLVALNSSYNFFRVWDLPSGEFLYDICKEEKHRSFLFSGMAAYPNAEKVIAITKDNCLIYQSKNLGNTLEVFDLTTGEHLHTIENGEQELAMISLHSCHKYLAVGNGTSVIVSTQHTKSNRRAVWNVWDVRAGKIVSDGSNPKMYKKDDRLRSLKIFGQDRMFVMTSVHREICLAYCGTVENPIAMAIPYRHLRGHSGCVVQMIVTSDDSSMYSAGTDNTIKFWDMRKVIEEFTEKYGSMEEEELASKMISAYMAEQVEMKDTTSLSVSSHGKEIFGGTSDGHIIVQSMKDDKLMADVTLESNKLTKLIVASRGKYVIAGSEKGKIYIWSYEESKMHLQLDLKAKLDCMAEANDVLVAATGGMSGKGLVWNIETGDQLREVSMLYGLGCVALNSVGTKLITTMFDFPTILGTMSQEDDCFKIGEGNDTQMNGATCVAVSPDDAYGFSGSIEGCLRVIDMNNGKYVYRLGQRSTVTTAKFSPDSKYIVSAGWQLIYVWSMQDGGLKFKVKKHTNFILNLIFNEKGTHMISSGQDKRIVVWDFQQGISLATFFSQSQPDLVVFGSGGEVVFYPEQIAMATTLQPNPILRRMLKGKYSESLSAGFTKAQGMALSFSSQKIRQQTTESGMCNIL